uniref:RdRp n=1 Tax=viral metagenome TaxID=1070528 RepID=A0A2V0RAA1_9ZZZZ
MDITKIPQSSLEAFLTPEAQIRSSGNFERIATGSKPTPRSPLYKKQSAIWIQERWTDILSSVANQDTVGLITYDSTRWPKFGPQGGFPPLSDRMEDLSAYYDNPVKIESTLKYTNPTRYWKLVEQVRSDLFGSQRDKRPLTPQSVIDRDRKDGKLTTNSSCPDYSKRGLPDVIANAVADTINGKWKTYPMILGSRSQRGKYRFIFLAPFSLNIREKMFLQPLMDGIRKHGNPALSAWEGFDDVEAAMNRQQFFKAKRFTARDFKAMDTTCGESVFEFFYDVTHVFFQATYWSDLKEVIMHGISIPVMISLDKLVTGNHGMLSGSGLTNIIETVVSYAVGKLIEEMINSELVGDQVLGDDGAFSDNATDITDEQLANVIRDASLLFGLVAQTEKQIISDHYTIYLQRYFTENIKVNNTSVVAGCYPSVLALNSAVNPERYHDPRKWGWEMETLRWIMILENCKRLPYFKDLVKFVQEGDSYKLGVEKPGFLDKGINKTYEEAKTITGFVPSYNQASLDRGIQDYEVVKLLRNGL